MKLLHRHNPRDSFRLNPLFNFCMLVFIIMGLNTAAYALEPISNSVFYVSPGGNDSWSGRLPSPTQNQKDGPFRTIQRARDQIRSERATKSNYAPRVLLRGGTYELEATLTFGPKDSGTSAAPIIYGAYESEVPIISGGKKISGDWVQNSNNPHIWEINLSQVRPGGWYFRNLFVNGVRRHRARWPKQGYFQIESTLPGANPRSQKDPISRTGYVYRGTDIDPKWKNLKDIEVITLAMWTAPRCHIKSINPASRQIIFSKKVYWPFGYWGLNWFYVENVYEKLGPGEWYLDRQRGTLSYWPLAGENINSIEIIAPKSTMNLMHCQAGSKYLKFAGLSFAYSDSAVNNALERHYLQGGSGIIINGEHITMDNCRVVHLGGYGIVLQPGSKWNLISNCVIEDLGAGGVRMYGSDSKSCNNYIANGGITDIGAYGLEVRAQNEAINNEVYHFPYIGILSKGKDANICYNNVHDVMEILSDGGGIYRSPDPGTALIANNLVHDIGYTSVAKIGAYGIYLDDNAHNNLVENNIIYNTVSACLHLNYGDSNIIRNNIFAFSEREGLLRRSAWIRGESIGWVVERNIFINDGTTSAKRDMIVDKGKDRRYKFNNNLYFVQKNHPLFYGMNFTAWQKTKSLELIGAVWNPAGLIRAGRPRSGKWEGGTWVDGPFQDTNSMVADPLFVNPAKYDFRLLPGSPAFKIGFRPIDVSRIGPQ